MTKRIGVVTGGGDCPGLNAVIRAVVRRSIVLGDYEIVGIKGGWKGLLTCETMPLDRYSVSGLIYRGGTILGTSRTNIFKEAETAKQAMENIKKLNLDAIIAIGGEDTLGIAKKLSDNGFNVVGVPKTIDNDLPGTDLTFGFDTAVEIATDAVDRLHTTAESHDRVLVCEVMGRHAGWIATWAGIAGGADAILIPEKPVDIDEVYAVIERRHKRGTNFSIIVVAEGAKIKTGGKDMEITSSSRVDDFGHVQLGGVGQYLAKLIEEKTGFETRVTVLGHIQRGGKPTALDRVLATCFGVSAMNAVHEGRFGIFVSLKGMHIEEVSLDEVSKELKTVDEQLYEVSRTFWGH